MKCAIDSIETSQESEKIKRSCPCPNSHHMGFYEQLILGYQKP